MIDNLAAALSEDGAFILEIDKNQQAAVSWWTSAKRSRTYPYGRVYDSLNFSGKKLTIIPVFKDEGKDGDRDFLQWDTISLMSLLGVYTIVSYYKTAKKSQRYKDKITSQRFDIEQVKDEISNLLSYQSDALHWNIAQISKIGEIAKKALSAYSQISRKLGVEMHSEKSAKDRIQEILKGKENFMNLSRELAKEAQNRESLTIQPKEKITGIKGTLTIKNYLGGYYFLTCDELKLQKDRLFLIESKHSKKGLFPSLGDIKDGLVKMILFANLEEVKVDGSIFLPMPVLKLTSNIKFSKSLLNKRRLDFLKLIKEESNKNLFYVAINDLNLNEIDLN